MALTMRQTSSSHKSHTAVARAVADVLYRTAHGPTHLEGGSAGASLRNYVVQKSGDTLISAVRNLRRLSFGLDSLHHGEGAEPGRARAHRLLETRRRQPGDRKARLLVRLGPREGTAKRHACMLHRQWHRESTMIYVTVCTTMKQQYWLCILSLSHIAAGVAC